MKKHVQLYSKEELKTLAKRTSKIYKFLKQKSPDEDFRTIIKSFGIAISKNRTSSENFNLRDTRYDVLRENQETCPIRRA